MVRVKILFEKAIVKVPSVKTILKILFVKIIVKMPVGRAIVKILFVKAQVEEEERRRRMSRKMWKRRMKVTHRAGWAFTPPPIFKPP